MATSKVEITGGKEAEFSSEEESQILSRLQEINFSLKRLIDTMDNNLSLLEGSVREVRTAHEIVAESNRMSRRQRLRDLSPGILVASK